mmetsp:Transcript_18264/g.38143  ORF Transcript_18264/g.38143 Transcript_18264/m.38143 type:complete len:281 (-) Transcript_18264:1155-1997(-)
MGRDEYCWKVCFVWGVEWSGLSGKGRVIGVDGRKGIRSGRVYRVRPVTALWGSAPWGSSSGGDLDGVERTGLGGVGKCSGADFEVDWSQPIATGSFGEVFFGSHIASGVPVVLKQARSVPLAKKLLSTERYVNRKLAATAAARQNQERRRRYWAAYLGEFERRSGTVLVWKREGDGSTLEDYLSRRPIQEIGSLLGAYDYGSGPFSTRTVQGALAAPSRSSGRFAGPGSRSPRRQASQSDRRQAGLEQFDLGVVKVSDVRQFGSHRRGSSPPNHRFWFGW